MFGIRKFFDDLRKQGEGRREEAARQRAEQGARVQRRRELLGRVSFSPLDGYTKVVFRFSVHCTSGRGVGYWDLGYSFDAFHFDGFPFTREQFYQKTRCGRLEEGNPQPVVEVWIREEDLNEYPVIKNRGMVVRDPIRSERHCITDRRGYYVQTGGSLCCQEGAGYVEVEVVK